MLPCQKNLFSLPEDVHYLNCATMAPNLKAVETAGIAGVLRKSQPYQLTQETFFEGTEAIRPLFAQLIHAPDPARVAVIPSVSYGMATVAKNLKARPGQQILLVESEFPSDVYAWDEVCQTQQLTRKVIPAPAGFPRGQRWNEALLEAITPQVALVAISPVHWADGTVFDLEAVGRRCREVGAWLVVDGTQALGAFPFDVQKIQPDALIAAGYKSMMGPYSLGLAWYGPAFDAGRPLEENWINRRGSENFRSLMDYTDDYRPGAARYSVGEQSNFILLPMLQAALTQLLAWTPEAVQAYCQALVSPFVGRWKALGFELEEEALRASHLFGLRPPLGTDTEQLRQELAARRVYVSLRGDSIRVAPSVYNDAADLEALTAALGTALQLRSA